MLPTISLQGRDYWEDYPEFDAKTSDMTHLRQSQQGLYSMGWRDFLNITLNLDTHVTQWSMYYFYLNVALILISVANFAVSTAPQFQDGLDQNVAIFVVDLVSTAFFTFDYIMRFTLTRKVRIMWVLQPANMIDLLSTLPFYISTLSTVASVRILFLLRIMRTLRLLRVLANINFAKEIKVYVKSFKNKFSEILAGLFIVVAVSVIMATAMYYAEQTASYFDYELGQWVYVNGQLSNFQSIGESIYFIMFAMSTVGYGDLFAHTILGRLVLVISIILGIFVYTFPLIILTISFNREIDIFKEQARNHQKLELLKLTSKGRAEEILFLGWRKLVEIHNELETLKNQVQEIAYVCSEYETLLIPFIAKFHIQQTYSVYTPAPFGEPRSLFEYFAKKLQRKSLET